MAKLRGILPIQGSVGDLTFSDTGNGIVVKSKGGVPARRIANDPAYERTRENNREFAVVSSTAKLVRSAFYPRMFVVPDSHWVNRLSKRMMRVVQSDTVHARGSRTVLQQHLALIQGYEFNEVSRLHDRLLTPPSLSYDPAGGKLRADFAAFLPDCLVDAPDETTHIAFSLGAARIAPGTHTFSSDFVASPLFAYGHQQESAFSLEVHPGGGLPAIAVIGLEFYKQVRHIHCPLNEGHQNAAAIQHVWC